MNKSRFLGRFTIQDYLFSSLFIHLSQNLAFPFPLDQRRSLASRGVPQVPGGFPILPGLRGHCCDVGPQGRHHGGELVTCLEQALPRCLMIGLAWSSRRWLPFSISLYILISPYISLYLLIYPYIPVEFFVTKFEVLGPLQNGFWLPFCAKF